MHEIQGPFGCGQGVFQMREQEQICFQGGNQLFHGKGNQQVGPGRSRGINESDNRAQGRMGCLSAKRHCRFQGRPVTVKHQGETVAAPGPN